ncbi:MAG: hypothetical protein KDE51_15640 [Anaerolineales bacterium]|nr:hypothetical protein [Anaerolineales bacterium]
MAFIDKETVIIMFRQFAQHHNKIQFFGYEVANLILVAQQLWFSDGPGYGFNAETFAALSLLLGSAFIWRFDPKTRPHLLFYGGIALACGGAFLAAAGYAWTGWSVVLASLETARGGRALLNYWINERQVVAGTVPLRLTIHGKIAAVSLGWYGYVVDLFIKLFPSLGRFINERPFITSTMIKAPLRLEFVAKKLLVGDWVGAAVGLSWLFLGDLALAMNDEQLRSYALQTEDVPSPAVQHSV